MTTKFSEFFLIIRPKKSEKAPMKKVILVFCFLAISGQIYAELRCSPTSFDVEALSRLSRNLESPMVLHPKDAADIVMNTFYQNCEAADLPPYRVLERGEMRGYELEKHPWNGGSASKIVNRQEALNSQYYIDCPQRPKRACRNLCEQPPTYIWGGKGVYQNNGEIDLFRNEGSIQQIANHPGIDCSGFVNASFAMAGLKVRPDKSPAEVAFGTPARWFMNPSQCFEQVDIGQPFKPGDVISWRKHLVMVDNCSDDPFKLKRLTDVSQCTSAYLDPLSFELVVSNSVGGVNDVNRDKRFSPADLYGDDSIKSVNVPITGVGVGVSKIPFGDLALKYPTEIMELAKAACYAKFGRRIEHSKINVTRHVLAGKNPMPARHSCLEPIDTRSKLKGLECLTENCSS